MYEVEVKVRADHEAVRERLEALDATPLGRVRQTDTYYSAPHRDFAATDEALRIRRESTDDESVHQLTYKGPKVDAESKTRVEAETSLGDHEAMATALFSLGFEPAADVSKDRERFAVGEYTVSLDTVDDLGEFVEVERDVDVVDGDPADDAVDDPADDAVDGPAHEAVDDPTAEAVDDAREGAFDILRDLGLDQADQIRTSYLGLVLGADEE